MTDDESQCRCWPGHHRPSDVRGLRGGTVSRPTRRVRMAKGGQWRRVRGFLSYNPRPSPRTLWQASWAFACVSLRLATGYQRGNKGKGETGGSLLLEEAEGPLLQADRLPTPSWRHRTLETLPSRSRCGGRIGWTAQAILAVGRLMGYSGPGTPGRWAVSRETFPKLLEINQPPSPLALLVPRPSPGGLHIPQRKAPS